MIPTAKVMLFYELCKLSINFLQNPILFLIRQPLRDHRHRHLIRPIGLGKLKR